MGEGLAAGQFDTVLSRSCGGSHELGFDLSSRCKYLDPRSASLCSIAIFPGYRQSRYGSLRLKEGSATYNCLHADSDTAACLIRPERQTVLDPAFEAGKRERRGEPSAIIDWYIETIPRVSSLPRLPDAN